MVLADQPYITTSTIIANQKLSFYFAMLHWRNNHKYYKLFEQKTLFNSIDIICVWGRIGGGLGNYKVIPCKNNQEVTKIIEQITKKRRNRGYKLVHDELLLAVSKIETASAFVNQDEALKLRNLSYIYKLNRSNISNM